MNQDMDPEFEEEKPAWLVFLTGPNTGKRFRIKGHPFKIGRGSDNDLIPLGTECARVSGRHMEIFREPGTWRIRDLKSTNGTFVDDMPVEEDVLPSNSIITLGRQGPKFRFVVGPEPETITKTIVTDTLAEETVPYPDEEKTYSTQPVDEEDMTPTSQSVESNEDDPTTDKDPKRAKHETLLQEAVDKARAARDEGRDDQTAIIMREMLDSAVTRSGRSHKAVIMFLCVALIGVIFYSHKTITRMEAEKIAIDNRIDQIEYDLQNADEQVEIDALIADLENFQERARDMRKNMLYKLGILDEEEDFVDQQIRELLAVFGADEYSIPPQFTERVHKYIQQYQNRDRRNIERAFGVSRPILDQIQAELKANYLPPDLAYIVVVETGFRMNSRSRKGAAGPWQFVPATARSYGLRVNKEVDERYEVDKATKAASRYIRNLILDFGTGSSVMLALAAYNLGPTRVKRMIRKVEDPIRQRNFWYLYRTRALPRETREYVPKIFAAIIIGRNPERFGFVT